jgi:diadenylate cyclase
MNGQVVRDIKEESLIYKLHEELRPELKPRNNEWRSFWKRKEGDDRG